MIERSDSREALLSVQPTGTAARDAGRPDRERMRVAGNRPSKPYHRDAELSLPVELAAGASREFVVKLPSPAVGRRIAASSWPLDFADGARGDDAVLVGSTWIEELDSRCRRRSSTTSSGRTSGMPLRLPRRHGGQGPGVKIDLPYSNFAYGQEGTPWPINQAVYVDDMIYDLRGYHDVALEELLSIYQNNQGPTVTSAATPTGACTRPGCSMPRPATSCSRRIAPGFERLLPATLRSMDWCLATIHQAANQSGAAEGLVRAPLNDGTGEGLLGVQSGLFPCRTGDAWARPRDAIGHPRARECLEAAQPFPAGRRAVSLPGRRCNRSAGSASRSHVEPLRSLRGH